MNIAPVKTKFNQYFGNTTTPLENTKEEKSKKTLSDKIPQNFDRKQVGGAVLATALSAAVIGGMLVYGRNRLALKRASGRIQELIEGNENQQKGFEKIKDRFSDLLESDLTPKELRERIYTTLKDRINGGKLSYDISTPPVTDQTRARVFDDAIELPKNVRTTNRADMVPLNIPKISSDGSFEFKLPSTGEIKATKAERKDFTPIPYTLTNISENYADSVRWNNDKIARDVLQNFFDGHGQTLDGIHFSFTPVGGKYRVRISGDSSYTADKAILLGESTKRDDVRAAGNYGEGLKMSALKLLKDAGADNVKFASDNWKLTYSLGKGDLSDKRLLGYSLDKVTPIEGNYIEFETTDRNLLETLRISIDRFYHSGNKHFKCPDFENDLVGIKILNPGEKGGIYVAGQRFEFDNNYDGLDEMVIFLKEKPDVSNFDPSRDRTSMDSYDFYRISRWLSNDNRMTNEEKVKLLTSLDKFWESKSLLSEGPFDYFVKNFAEALGSKNIHIKFPSNYIAYSNASNELVFDLKLKGYRICKSEFAKLGMPTIREFMGDARAHEIVAPTEKETKRIMILKEAIQNLGRALKDKHFTEEELDSQIFLFNNKGEKDKKLYNDVLAEAIIDSGVSKGFWIDRDYLNTANFSDVLETALHELSHKAGGDESSAFSYKLTNVNQEVIKHLLNDIRSRNEIQALNKLWVEVGY